MSDDGEQTMGLLELLEHVPQERHLTFNPLLFRSQGCPIPGELWHLYSKGFLQGRLLSQKQRQGSGVCSESEGKWFCWVSLVAFLDVTGNS